MNITHNESQRRYELEIDGELAAIAEYTPSDGTLIFDHTYTEPAFRGRGLAAQVVRAALDDVRKGGHKIVPSCWFVAEFIDENPAYADLVA
jgi:predicted GNAT family acetyltransferase